MKRGKLLKTTFVTLMVCATAGTLFACGGDKEYKVVYLGGEGATGDAPAEATYKEGDKFNLATNTFTKANHTFKGWSDGTSTYLEGVEYTMGAADVTFTALWEENSAPITYTVTYALGDHAASDATVPSAVGDLLANAQVTLPNAPKAAEGYEFTGWKVGSDSTLKNAGDKITVTANVTVTAQWKAKEVTPPVDDKYATDTEIKDQIKPVWDPTKSYYVADGEEVTVQATLTAETALAHTGLLTDMNINDDWYRFRPDAQVFGWKPWNTWLPASDDNVIPTQLVIDATQWNLEAYQALFADSASAIQVVKVSLDNDVVTVTVTNYAGTDTKLATPVTSAKYTVTLTTETSEIQPFFYTDGGAVVSTASAKYSKASNTFVNLTFDFDTEDVEDAVVPMRPGKADYVFGPDPVKPGYAFLGWKSSDTADTNLYKNTDTVPVTSAVTYTAQWEQEHYTVTYALGGNAHADATAPEAVSGKIYGDKITLPEAPAAADGYEFDGWQVGDDTTLKAPEAEIEITGDVTITAVFKGKEEYTATYKPGDHAAEGEVDRMTTVFYDDAEVTLPNAPEAATGYEFAGWKVGDETELKQAGDKITLTADTDVVAQWKAIEYTVTFALGDHAAEGEAEKEIYANKKADFNTEIDLPAGPEAATGYSFTGWKVGASETIVHPNDKLLVTADTTLTAQWVSTENSWTVTFLANEGDETAHYTATVEKGGKLTLPAKNPAKTGYRFDGWYLFTDETKAKVTADTVVTANSTYLALWVETVVATFKANAEDDTAFDTVTVDKGSTLTLPQNDPEKTGYTFKGWYLSTDNEKTHLDAENLPTLNEAVTYLADWEEITYTVTFKVEGQDDVELTVGYGKKLSEVDGFSAIVTEKEYYRFDGWKNGQDTATGDTIPTADITYTASYTQVEALPSANQNPTADAPIVIAPTAYEPNPLWIGKVHKGEIVTLTGTMTGGPSNWNTATMFIYSGLTPWGNFRIDNFVNYGSWALNGQDQLTLSNVAEENWQVIKYDRNNWGDFAGLITDCNVTISYDWTNEGYILVTAVIAKDAKNSTQVYMVAPKGATFDKDTYSIGLAGDTSTTTINAKTVSKTAPQPEAAPNYSENQNPTADNKIEVGADGNVLGYTALNPVWTGKIEKGEKVVMSGTMTSKAQLNHQTAVLYFYEGAAPNHNLRGDAWVNGFGELDGKFLIAPTGWDITRVADIDGEAVNWDTARAIFANNDVEFTFDFTDVKKCVVTFKATGKDGDAAGKVFACTWTYVMRSGADMGDLNYSIGLGGEEVHILVDSIVRTTAGN